MIRNFSEWSTTHAAHSSASQAYEVLKAVYRVCNASAALVHTVENADPKLNARETTYSVEMQLCGPPAEPGTVEVKYCASEWWGPVLSIWAVW